MAKKKIEKVYEKLSNEYEIFAENDNGGTASTNLDCTAVRPKWPELRDAIKQGCEGFTDTISDFPCEQAEPCQ